MDTRSTSDRAGRPKRKAKKPDAPATKAQRRALQTIGWREWAAFHDLGVARIKAKIDTGAKTSAIHAYRIRTEMRAGVLWAHFFLHPEQKRRIPEIRCAAPVVGRRRFRSSNGAVDLRYVIETPLSLGGRRWPIQLSLANRDEMGFRLLLGRDALRKKFIIDPGASFLLGR